MVVARDFESQQRKNWADQIPWNPQRTRSHFEDHLNYAVAVKCTKRFCMIVQLALGLETWRGDPAVVTAPQPQPQGDLITKRVTMIPN